ncbi:MAG: nitrogen fixation protein NifQ [Sideroxydans sp.]|nr:nitrogen fixation protein NifQ [Sideroxydans sp.]
MLYPRSHGGLTAGYRPAAAYIGVWHLLGHSTEPGDVLGGAYAWVIAARCNPGCDAFVPALGLGPDAFARLLAGRFPRFVPPEAWLAAQSAVLQDAGPLAEFGDLLQLLLDHRTVADEHHRQVAHLVAAACMGSDHLWQDLGLPSRQALSTLLSGHFPQLAAKNTGDMKWKKFFYKQLCEREGINVCKSPSCSVCCDYEKCFGPEDESR